MKASAAATFEYIVAFGLVIGTLELFLWTVGLL
jgi:hypothetical protein